MEHNPPIAALIDQVRKTLATERRVPAKESIGDDSQRPHIYRLSVTLFQHYFWSSIAEGAGHGREHLIAGVKHLSDTEIGKHE